MTRVYLNGKYLCPNYDEVSGGPTHYAGEGDKIIFECTLSPGDYLIIEKSFLGICYSRRFYVIVDHVLRGGYWRRVSRRLKKKATVKLPPATNSHHSTRSTYA